MCASQQPPTESPLVIPSSFFARIPQGSIKEQRESLPVYALKGQFMAAMAKNQVRYVMYACDGWIAGSE